MDEREESWKEALGEDIGMNIILTFESLNSRISKISFYFFNRSNYNST